MVRALNTRLAAIGARSRLRALWRPAVVTALAAAAASPATSAPATARFEHRVAACTVCHGDQGRAGTDAYYPRIAGKPEGYLYNQLLNFRDGRRQYALMTHLLDFLPDEYLREIARHFAGLDPPYPPPVRTDAPAALLEQGRAMALSGDPARNLPPCAACHGDDMMGANPAIPGLLGLPRDYVNAQLGAWTAGTRRAAEPDCMASIARRLTPQDVAAVSTWLAAQPVPPGAKPAERPDRLPMRCGGVADAGTGTAR
jgi:cytochrome c553